MFKSAVVIAFLILLSSAVAAQKFGKNLRVEDFFTVELISAAASISGDRAEWGKSNCPNHFAENYWLSTLGAKFVEALRNSKQELFVEQVKNSNLDLKDILEDQSTSEKVEASRRKYEVCKQIWIDYFTIETAASRAYWAAGWRP